jgi:hypothetical protein
MTDNIANSLSADGNEELSIAIAALRKAAGEEAIRAVLEKAGSACTRNLGDEALKVMAVICNEVLNLCSMTRDDVWDSLDKGAANAATDMDEAPSLQPDDLEPPSWIMDGPPADATVVPFPERRSKTAPRPAASPQPFAFDPAPYDPPEPTKIPPREWLYGRYFIRGVVSATLGAPGRAKSTKEMTDAISMVFGLDLMDGKKPLPCGPLRVAYTNGEENQDELDRRFTAICQWYELDPEEIKGRIWIISTRDNPVRLAVSGPGGVGVIVEEVVAALEAFAEKNKIDVLIFDPLVSFHRLKEAEAGDMDMLYKEGFGRIAGKTRAVDLAIHPRKPAPGVVNTTMDDLRGTGAQEGAIRAARILNFMTSTEAAKLGIDENERRRHVRVEGGKNNSGPIASATWLKLEVADLPNGDAVAVATPWNPPNPFEGVTVAQMRECRKVAQGGAYRADIQAKEWFGHKVAEIIKLPLNPSGERDKAAYARVSAIIKKWSNNEVLAEEEREDPKTRKKKRYIIPGPNNLSEEFDDDVQLTTDD